MFFVLSLGEFIDVSHVFTKERAVNGSGDVLIKPAVTLAPHLNKLSVGRSHPGDVYPVNAISSAAQRIWGYRNHFTGDGA